MQDRAPDALHPLRVFMLVAGVFIPLALVCFALSAMNDGRAYDPLQLVAAAVAVGAVLGLVAASG